MVDKLKIKERIKIAIHNWHAWVFHVHGAWSKMTTICIVNWLGL